MSHNPFGSTGGVFGNPSSTSATSVFGGSATAFGSSQPSGFGQTVQASGNNTFGQMTSGSSPFGSNDNKMNTPSVFGSLTTPSPFGSATTSVFSSAFGSSAPQPYGATTSSSAFGSSAPPPYGSTTSSSALGSSAPPPPYGSTTSSSAFGSSSTPTFGSTTSASVFGASTNPPAFGAANTAPIFGASTTSAFGSTLTTASFGPLSSQPASGISAFGTAAKTQSAFGNVAATRPALGGTSATQPSFGVSTTSSSPFGNTSNTGIFGGTGTQAVFGGQPTGNGSTTSVTSSGSVFGSIVQGSIGAGSTVSNVFGTGNGSSITSSGFGVSGVFGGTSSGTAFADGATSGVFGGSLKDKPENKTGGVFGTGSATSATTTSTTTASVFGGKSAAFGVGSSSVFGNTKKKEFGNEPESNMTTAPSTITFNFKPPTKALGSLPASNVFGGSADKAFGGKTDLVGNVFGGSLGARRASTGDASKALDKSSAESKRRLNVATGTGKHGDTHVEEASDEEEIRPPSRNDASRKQLFKSEDPPEEDSTEEKPKKSIVRRSIKPTGAGAGLFGKAIAGVGFTKKSDFKVVRSVVGSEKLDERSSEPSTSRAVSVQRRTSTSKVLSRKSSLSDDIASKTAIVCTNVNPKINDVKILKSHFSKFGQVKKVLPQTKSQTAIIYFENHDFAAKAKKLGHQVEGHGGVEPFNIYWRNFSPAANKSSLARRSNAFSTSSRTLKKSDKLPSHDVDDELQSMMGPSDVSNDNISGLDRSSIQKKRPTDTKKLSQLIAKRKRPEISKATVKKTEPTTREASPAKLENAPGVSFVSLKSLTNIKAKTTSERFEILDNRDKIMKMGRTKQADLATAKVFVGTCRDMCPEKERYVREDRRRLSKYEIIPGTDIPGQNPSVDHSKAVKEYSRSSADQEEPLLHELRPSGVLDMTMNYLMHHVMDKGGEGEWEEWFEFLWSRTRGIRKDITQQMLCDVTSTELTEKCARFHIYCAERLCEEPMQIFDTKINNENLTKCLQSLKEMYFDLEKNRNTLPPNVAEFRAYMVLMNLNEGDTLREVQQLRDEVRLSPQINFVLSVYSALNFNNYVKFFKLVKKAPFLYACIMHRYFTQVRRKALLTINKAFGNPNHRQYPVSELVRQLAFEDETEATEFCEHHGLTVQDDGHVLLDRAAFIEPEAAFPGRRAIKLIESKQIVSVGEVVNGGPLPAFVLHTPSSSFTEDGRFKAEDITLDSLQAKSRENQAAGPTAEQDTTVVPSTDKSQQKQAPSHPYSNEAVKEVAKELFLEVINEMCVGISSTLESAIVTYMSTSNHILSGITEEITQDEIRKLHRELITEAKLQQEEEQRAAAQKEAAEREVSKQRIADEVRNQVVEQVMLQELQGIATAEVRDYQSQIKRDRIERSSSEVNTTFMDEFVEQEIFDVAMEICDDVERRLHEAEENKKCVELLRTARYFKQWREKFAKQLRLKRGMINFPVAPSVMQSKQQLDYLIPESEGRVGQSHHLGKKAHLTLDSPSKREVAQKRLMEAMNLQNYVRRLHKQKAWSSYNLQKSIGQTLLHRQIRKSRSISGIKEKKKIYWKLFLSLPDLNETDDVMSDQSYKLVEWIQKKFKKGLVPCSEDYCDKVTLLSLYTSPLEGSQCAESLSVCVRSCVGVLTEEEAQQTDKLFLGSNGLVFYLPPPLESSDDVQCYWLLSRLRLAGFVQSIPVYPPIPVIVVIVTTASWNPAEDEVAENLNVHSFVDQGCLSTFNVVYLDPDVNTPKPSEQLLLGVKWLAKNCALQPKLEKRAIRELLEDVLNEEFYTPVYQNLSLRRKHGYLHQAPDVIISLYNCVIQHLCRAVCDSRLQHYSWPVPEFVSHDSGLPSVGWNSEDQLSLLSSLMESLCLPEFVYQHEDCDDWHSACHDVWHYVDLLTQDEHNKIPLYSRIRGLLRKSKADFEDRCFLDLHETECVPTYMNLPWTEIMVACVDYQLSLLHPAIADSTEGDDFQEILVYYGEDLGRFQPPTVWTEALREENEKVGSTLEASVIYSVKRKQEETILPGCSKQPRFDQSRSFIDLEPEKPNVMTAKDTANDLASFMSEEKRKSIQYEEFLQRSLALGDDSELDTSTFNHLSNDSLSIRPLFSSPSTSFNQTSSHNRRSDSGCTAPPNEENMSQSSDEQNCKRRRHSLNDEFLLLQQQVQASREASRLYEMRLQQMLGE